MRSGLRNAIALLTAASLSLQSTAPLLAQTAGQSQSQRPGQPASSSSGSISRADYEGCQTQDEAAFRRAVRTITLAALKAGTETIDYDALVRDQWRFHNLDEVIDKRVDLAAAEVRSETSWGQLLKSLAYRDKAKDLATAVAERVYRSDAIKTSLEAMAIGVGREVGKAIELSTADAARPAQRCLQTFLGPRYGRTVARAVIHDTGAAFVVAPDQATASTSGTTIATNASGAIAGAVILLVRRQLTRMAQRIGQRVVGSVLGRIVAVVAGGIGVVLIAKDVWDLRYGVLPIVADEMKSKTTKAKVREELALAIKSQIAQQLDTLADTTSDRIVDIWRDFKQAHLKVLELARENSAFKEFIDTARPSQLARIDEIVALVLKNGGKPAIFQRLSNGVLQEAVTKLPDTGMQIARDTQSVDTAIAWHNLAGGRLDDVIRHDLHKRTAPKHFSRTSLSRLLSVGDAVVTGRLAAVKPTSRDVLFGLGDDKLIHLARVMDVAELDTLAGYITGLAPAARQEVLSQVAAAPASMRVLGSPTVRDAIFASSDQLAAVKMMLRQDRGFNISAVRADFELALNRKIDPLLFWSKHPILVVAAGLLALILLLILRRIFFAPRRRAAAAAPEA